MSNSPKRDFKSKRIIGEGLILVANKEGSSQRITVSISKKVAPRAVDRNRIKRIIKESLRTSDQFKGEARIIVKKNLADLKMPEVRVKLEKLFKKT